jgi:hypothetical protein
MLTLMKKFNGFDVVWIEKWSGNASAVDRAVDLVGKSG